MEKRARIATPSGATASTYGCTGAVRRSRKAKPPDRHAVDLRGVADPPKRASVRSRMSATRQGEQPMRLADFRDLDGFRYLRLYGLLFDRNRHMTDAGRLTAKLWPKPCSGVAESPGKNLIQGPESCSRMNF